MIPNTDNREIISTKSQGFSQTPQDIMRSTMGVQSSSTDASEQTDPRKALPTTPSC